MDGATAKKSTSLETLVIQNIANINDLKAKLNDIIKCGKDYEYDVSSCLETLLTNSDQDIVLLTIQAVSELVKCEDKRETYAQKEVITPIINIMNEEVASQNIELIKQCCRSLGNLCCDCDTARNIILQGNGIPVLKKLLEHTLEKNGPAYDEIKILISKSLLNFAIGGQEFSDSIVQEGLIDLLYNILVKEQYKVHMCDEMVSTVLLILSVINDNTPDYLFDEKINKVVLGVLRETTSIEISELCLDHLHVQAEHDSVKTLLANEGGLQLFCSRLETLMQRRDSGDLNAEGSEVDAIIKQACDLIIIVLTGDEAMHILYNNGLGEVYLTMVKWLESSDHQILTTAVLAIGNFARQDDYCMQMMDSKIFDRLLEIFKVYHKLGVQLGREGGAGVGSVTRLQHGVVAALRNLSVPRRSKRAAAAAAPALLAALPRAADAALAYRLLAALRMLVDGQESVAREVACAREALSAAGRWGREGGAGGAAGEAPRLLAWTVRALRHSRDWTNLVEVDGCITSLVNMLVVCHSVMQNEAILALTLLAIEVLKDSTPTDQPTDYDYEKSFITQLIKSEIGTHIAVLIDTNCAKMPIEVAENLMAFLDITSKKNDMASEYKDAKIHESLKKFSEARKDLSDDLKHCINGVVNAISNNGIRT